MSTPPRLHVPFESPVQAHLQRLFERFAGVDDGVVASYIPELAKADPSQFAIVIATVDGQVYEVGASRTEFTIQSVSKPLVYGMALEDSGRERVRRAIGVEPSGDAFNSISLEAGTGRPLNPMINAGAIAASALVSGSCFDERLERVLGAMSAYAGRPLAIDDAVYESERTTGHRNRAIGHLLRNYDILTDDPEPTLNLYFKQCSVLITCRDLALMAATLANGGQNPLTGQCAVRGEHLGDILSVMTTCGMYDFAGEWVTRVGMPAKSGVGGGIMAVLPGQLGIGVFSPPLDERGNSVRGVKVVEALSQDLGLHFLRPPQASAATVRARYSLADVRSKRRRVAAEQAELSELGRRAVVFELQGDLRFSTVEPVIRDIARAQERLSFIVLDFKRVSSIDDAAIEMLARLIDSASRMACRIVLSRVQRGSALDGLGARVDPRHVGAMSFQPQLDLALEWCEYELLLGHGIVHAYRRRTTLAEHRLCEGMSADEIAMLESGMVCREYDPGSMIFECGDPADAIYLMLAGNVSVVVDLKGGSTKRLSTLTAGMAFGESALVDGGVRMAAIRADTRVECAVLPRRQFDRLEREQPALTVRLLRNLLLTVAETAGRLTAEVSVLEA